MQGVKLPVLPAYLGYKFTGEMRQTIQDWLKVDIHSTLLVSSVPDGLGNGTMRVSILGVELCGFHFTLIYFLLATI